MTLEILFFPLYLDVKLFKKVIYHFAVVQYDTVSTKITMFQEKSNELNILSYSFLPLQPLWQVFLEPCLKVLSSLQGTWKLTKSRLFWAVSGWEVVKWELDYHVWWIIAMVRKTQLITAQLWPGLRWKGKCDFIKILSVAALK